MEGFEPQNTTMSELFFVVIVSQDSARHLMEYLVTLFHEFDFIGTELLSFIIMLFRMMCLACLK